LERKIHQFDNGIRVYDDHLLDEQRKRYAERNVHEADEEEFFITVIRSLPPQGCFVSVGAAIGYYILLARQLAPRLTIHAFEPLPRHEKYFWENVSLNGYSSSDFHFHPEAVAASDGYARLEDASFGSRLNTPSLILRLKRLARQVLNRLGFKHYKVMDSIRVKTVSLASAVQVAGGSVDLLQMDIQGFEFQVLNAGLPVLQSGSVKTFLIGTHGAAIHQSCLQILLRCGYTIELEQQQSPHQPDGILLARFQPQMP
jgi:FkbM family methyltransferase